MKRLHRIVAAGLTVLLAAAPARAQEEIVIGMLLPITGPFAFVAKYHHEAIQDFFGHVNANGGIRGHKIRPLIEDTSYKVDQAVAAYKKLMASDRPAVIFQDGTGTTRAITPENNERFRALMTGNSFASDLSDGGKYPYNFMPGHTYSDAVAILLKHIKDTHKGSAKPKLAVVHSSTEYGRDPLEFIKKRAGELGIDLVLITELKLRDVDVTPEVIKLRQARPDYTIIHGFGGAPVFLEVMKLAREYKLDTQFMGTFWEGSRFLMKRVGEVGDGYLVSTNYNFCAAGQEGGMLKLIDEIQRRKGGDYDGCPDIFYMQAWFGSMLIAKAIDLTLAAGQPLSGENMRAQLLKLQSWDTGGVIGLPVTFKDQRIPIGRLVRFDGKANAHQVGDWIRIE